MACARALTLCLFAAIAALATSQLATDEERSSIMRRQKSSSQVHLGPSGEMHLHEDLHRSEDPSKPERKLSKAAQAWIRVTQNGKINQRQPGEISWCDTSYPLGTENSNVCEKGKKITRIEDCKHAAGVLNFTVGAPNFEVKDDWVNPNAFAKDCFLFNKTVFFNPTESVRTDGWKGTPICEYPIYKTANDTGDSEAMCTGDYEPITDYKECEWAHDCQWGGMFCQDPHFGNDKYTTKEAPKGCYRNKIGCYGYNDEKSAVDDTWNITAESRAVCRLKTYKFTGGETE